VNLDKTRTPNFDPPKDRTVEEEQDPIVVHQNPDLGNPDPELLDPDLDSPDHGAEVRLTSMNSVSLGRLFNLKIF
jgi:hypothetical protein